MASDHHTFEQHAVWLMERLLADLPKWGIDDAAACAGNGGGESGLQAVQEKAVPAPKGGYDWFQWTGPRRTALYKFCQAHGYDVDSDEANYQFLRFELEGTEKAAVQRVAVARRGPGQPDDLYAKTVAFEEAFERAGIKNWDARYAFAKRALVAYKAKHGSTVVTPAKPPPLGPVIIEPPPKPTPTPLPAPTPQPEPGSPAAVGRFLLRYGPLIFVAAVVVVVVFFIFRSQGGH